MTTKNASVNSGQDGIEGKYIIKCPEFLEQQYGSKSRAAFSIDLCLSSTRNNLWGRWDLKAYRGYLRCTEPYEAGKMLYFEIRGEETGENEQFIELDSADSWIEVNEENNTIKGSLGPFRWAGGPFEFTGIKGARKAPTVEYCKKQFRANNEWNERNRSVCQGWEEEGGPIVSEVAYESDTTQESDVEEMRNRYNRELDKVVAEKAKAKAKKGEKSVGEEIDDEKKNPVGKEKSQKKRKRAESKDTDEGEEDDERIDPLADPLDDDRDDEDCSDEESDDDRSWLVLREEAIIEEHESVPCVRANFSFDHEGFKLYGYKILEPKEVVKLAKEKSSKPGLFKQLQAQLTLYGLKCCTSIATAQETILKAYEENGLKDDAMYSKWRYNMETEFNITLTEAYNAKVAKILKQKSGGNAAAATATGKHKPSTASAVVRVGRERAKQAIIKRRQESKV